VATCSLTVDTSDAIFHTIGSISTAEGSALVKLGNTTIVCGVKAVSKLSAIFFLCEINYPLLDLAPPFLF